jgi:D-alanyl-D-alanine carboxypeptidase
MLRIRIGARHGLRGGAFGFATFAAVLALSNNSTQAAPYADIVMDANSGNVLHATNPDARRHPASLTKIMTLYLLFEQLEAGRLKLDSQLKVSEEAAGQSPTKLGLKAGSTIQLEDAIKGIITRSANDAAVVVAEAIAGDEDEFAKLMTKKAQALGMSRTLYRNASGLPDDDQVTTARDQAILGRAIQERFPRYYKYFSTRSFTFRGQWIANHNQLLGRVEGVDGIKTGYIRASGFNLVTSVRRGNRYIVAVVLGGVSAGSRDAKMRELISTQIARASTSRTATVVAEAADTRTEVKPVARAEAKSASKREKVAAQPEAKPAPKLEAKPGFAVASTTSGPVRLDAQSEAGATTALAHSPVPAGSTDPIRPVLVRTVAVRAGTQVAAAAPTHAAPPASQAAAPAAAPSPTPIAAAKPDPAAVPATKTGIPTLLPVRSFDTESVPTPSAPAMAAPTPAAKPAPVVAAAIPAATPAATPAPAVAAAPPAPAPAAKPAPMVAAVTPAPAPAAKPAPVVAAAPPAPAPAPKPAPVVAAAPPAPAPAPKPAPVVAAAPPAPAPAAKPAPVVAAAPPAPAPAPKPAPVVAAVTPGSTSAAKPTARSGWMIQVGAYPAEHDAKQRLSVVQNKASKVLTGADPFTESVDKGGTTLYRARFAGFDKDQAEAACKFLKRESVECVTIRN